ncbi:MAG: hypothetical protein M3328_11060 [Chloroflexota bacterium]|nr:hypothetical protein [Chloroflexota bacterium]
MRRGPLNDGLIERTPMPPISTMLSRKPHSRQQVLTLHDNSPPGPGARLL